MIKLNLGCIERASTVLEIEAAILKVMEKIDFRVEEINTTLTEGKTEGNLMTVFVVQGSSATALYRLEKELGEKFSVHIIGKGKNVDFLTIEAPKENFINLGNRYTYQEPQRSASSGGFSSQPNRSQYNQQVNH